MERKLRKGTEIASRHQKCAKAPKKRQGTENASKHQKSVKAPKMKRCLKSENDDKLKTKQPKIQVFKDPNLEVCSKSPCVNTVSIGKKFIHPDTQNSVCGSCYKQYLKNELNRVVEAEKIGKNLEVPDRKNKDSPTRIGGTVSNYVNEVHDSDTDDDEDEIVENRITRCPDVPENFEKSLSEIFLEEIQRTFPFILTLKELEHPDFMATTSFDQDFESKNQESFEFMEKSELVLAEKEKCDLCQMEVIGISMNFTFRGKEFALCRFCYGKMQRGIICDRSRKNKKKLKEKEKSKNEKFEKKSTTSEVPKIKKKKNEKKSQKLKSSAVQNSEAQNLESGNLVQFQGSESPETEESILEYIRNFDIENSGAQFSEITKSELPVSKNQEARRCGKSMKLLKRLRRKMEKNEKKLKTKMKNSSRIRHKGKPDHSYDRSTVTQRSTVIHQNNVEKLIQCKFCWRLKDNFREHPETGEDFCVVCWVQYHHLKMENLLKSGQNLKTQHSYPENKDPELAILSKSAEMEAIEKLKNQIVSDAFWVGIRNLEKIPVLELDSGDFDDAKDHVTLEEEISIIINNLEDIPVLDLDSLNFNELAEFEESEDITSEFLKSPEDMDQEPKNIQHPKDGQNLEVLSDFSNCPEQNSENANDSDGVSRIFLKSSEDILIESEDDQYSEDHNDSQHVTTEHPESPKSSESTVHTFPDVSSCLKHIWNTICSSRYTVDQDPHSSQILSNIEKKIHLEMSGASQ